MHFQTTFRILIGKDRDFFNSSCSLLMPSNLLPIFDQLDRLPARVVQDYPLKKRTTEKSIFMSIHLSCRPQALRQAAVSSRQLSGGSLSTMLRQYGCRNAAARIERTKVSKYKFKVPPEGDLQPFGKQHLHAHQHQDQCERDLQVPELIHHPGQGKIERPETQDREYVAGEHQEWVARNGKIAGIESTAKMTSVVSTMTSASASGVRSNVPGRAASTTSSSCAGAPGISLSYDADAPARTTKCSRGTWR